MARHAVVRGRGTGARTSSDPRALDARQGRRSMRSQPPAATRRRRPAASQRGRSPRPRQIDGEAAVRHRSRQIRPLNVRASAERLAGTGMRRPAFSSTCCSPLRLTCSCGTTSQSDRGAGRPGADHLGHRRPRAPPAALTAEGHSPSASGAHEARLARRRRHTALPREAGLDLHRRPARGSACPPSHARATSKIGAPPPRPLGSSASRQRRFRRRR